MARRMTLPLSPRIDPQIHAAVATIVDWLDTGMITPIEALRNIETLRQHDPANREMADVCREAVGRWSAAEQAHTLALFTRSI